MLPTPASYNSKRGLHVRTQRKTRDILLQRARVTNLGLLLLVCVSALSLLFNLGFYFSSVSATYEVTQASSTSSILATIERDRKLYSLDHLVIVPGHAIWKGSHPERNLDEDNWILEPYQKGGGRVSAFYSHIQRGVDITLSDERALLVFSGGQTRRASTTTEAESYLRLALSTSLLPATDQQHFLRATTEDYALDSYQNLLFSIARFHEYTGHYPSRITIVGYEMKRKRFSELHRTALRWPEDKFEYIGIDVEGEEVSKAREGERRNGYIPYSLDAYGCHDALLDKRRSRNVFIRFHPYLTSSPELIPLFDWCPGKTDGGQTKIYNGPLPWDRRR